MINREDPKILFIHHTAMWYRIPFFRSLSELYDVQFLFTNVEGYNKTYDTQLSHDILGMESVNYKVVPNRWGIAWGAIKRTLGEYDVFVGGSWDTPTDVIETLFYFIIVKLKRKPFVLWREDWDWNVQSNKRKIAKALAGFLGRHANAVLVPGSKHQEFFTGLGVSPEKVFIMPNVSNLMIKKDDYTNRDMIRSELNLNEKKIILLVGRLIDLKGVQYLIKAFHKLQKKMDDVVLIIVGEGECREELEKLTQKFDLEDMVYFRGNVDQKLLGAYYLLCNLFVLPSITTHHADACPLVVNEAMYFTKPVITSDAVGTTFMIKNGINGYVVPERDSEALYQALYKILSNPELEENMGKASKKVIDEGFTYQNMVEGFKKALNYLKLDKE
ncbi:MAG: Trehalose synthase [Methanobacterium sp. PtaU1.Bin242]|nr:MAG: Trehalose synthase [Methanobacterium sp. PtaU1.Bin242]